MDANVQPGHVSHLILMNSAAASHQDYLLFRLERLKQAAADIEQQKGLAASDGYKSGDPATVAEYYRIHFRSTFRQPEQLQQLIERLKSSFTNEGILKAWAIEEQLMNQTQRVSDYDLLPKLSRLNIPTLVMHGEHDLVPPECAVHIAQAVPGA